MPEIREQAINVSAMPWFSRYVSTHAIEVVQKAFDELRENAPEPFSRWQRWTTDAPRLEPAVYDRLRRHLVGGGIVIMVGRPAFPKSSC